MCRFGLDFNSAGSDWLIVSAFHQTMAVGTLMRVQGPTTNANTWIWIEMQPKCTHLPNHQFIFLICHPLYLCDLIRVLTAITWCKAKTISQTLTAELKSSPNLHIYPAIYYTFFICHPCHLCTLIRVPTTHSWFKSQQIMKTLAFKLKCNPSVHIYSTIQLYMLFIDLVDLAPENGGGKP